MTTPEPHAVGNRCDWHLDEFRLDFAPGVLELLRTRAETARGEIAPVAIAFGKGPAPGPGRWGKPGTRTFKMTAPRSSGRWLLQSAMHRVEILEHGAGGGEDGSPGWNVFVTTSGTALLAMGLEGAMREAHALANDLGGIHEMRAGRTDLCVDVAGFNMRPDDRYSFVKSRRTTWRENLHEGKPIAESKTRRTTSGEQKTMERVSWRRDGRPLLDEDDGYTANYVGDDTFTGFSFGLSRKAVSARIYDKPLELRTPKKGARGVDSQKRREEFREWRRNGWLGMDDEPNVARVEFQVCGEALDELGLRCSTRPETGGVDAYVRGVLDALDPAWQYLTRKWLRLVRRGAGDVVQCRWRVVQETKFERAAEPRKRMRERGAAKAAQALGASLSLLGSLGKLTHSAIEESTGEVLTGTADPSYWNESPVGLAMRTLPRGDGEEALERAARSRLRKCVVGHFVRAGEVVAEALEERAGGAVAGLGNFLCRELAVHARFPLERFEYDEEGELACA